MNKYQTTNQANDDILLSPDAFAEILAAEIFIDIKKNDGIISQQLLKKSILSGLVKLDLVSITDDSETEDTQDVN